MCKNNETKSTAVLRLKWYEVNKNRSIGPRTSALLQCVGLISDIYENVTSLFMDEYDYQKTSEITNECHEALDQCRAKLIDLVGFSIDSATSVDSGII